MVLLVPRFLGIQLPSSIWLVTLLVCFVQNIATAVAGLLIGFGKNWELALIILLLILLMRLSGYVQIKSMRGFGADAKVYNLINIHIHLLHG